MKLALDTWLVFGRYFGLFIRNPAWVALGVLQPVIYLVLFGPLLKSISSVQGFPPGGAYNVFVPGLLVQLGMFGAAGVGFSLIAELRAGVIERLRVTPVSRVSLPPSSAPAGGSASMAASEHRALIDAAL